MVGAHDPVVPAGRRGEEVGCSEEGRPVGGVDLDLPGWGAVEEGRVFVADGLVDAEEGAGRAAGGLEVGTWGGGGVVVVVVVAADVSAGEFGGSVGAGPGVGLGEAWVVEDEGVDLEAELGRDGVEGGFVGGNWGRHCVRMVLSAGEYV